MDLGTLLSALPGLTGASAGPGAAVDVVDVAYDSRAVVPGSLFACLVGEHVDGHAYAEEAVRRGAVALLCERPLGSTVPEIVVSDTRVALGPLAARLHGDPSRALTVIGVTGTNGKTTTVHLLGAILGRSGRRCGVIGTLTGARTTPEAPDLQARLAELRSDGFETVAMEVSSHALALHRVDGTWFRAVGFTNLTQDHLDFHGTLEAYFEAKARLFTSELSERGVVCVEDAWGERLISQATVPTVAVHPSETPEQHLGPGGSRFGWRGHQVDLPLAGRFNIANAVLAAELASAVGVADPDIVRGLEEAPAVPGRFELVDAGQPFAVVVDYAHTPDGLARALSSAREIASGRVVVVFGCGGDRDRAKRPLMGSVAAALADEVIVTNDNPRSESPGSIIDEILGGIADARAVRTIPDRTDAIAAGLASAREHDVVVIAGKGHETTQTIGDEVRDFDDRVVVRVILGHAAPPEGRA